MDLTVIGALAACFLLYGAISGKLERSIVTGPMIFMALGWLAHRAGWIEADLESRWVHLLAEIALILILFTDASRIDLSELRREHAIPLRLLGIGLPLTIALGALAALALFGQLSHWEALVLAVMLAPTDAALGQAVVSNRVVPARIRQALNVESGLNDGIALPVLVLFLCLAGWEHSPAASDNWLSWAGQQILIGPVIGVAIGWGGIRLVSRALEAGWVAEPFQRLTALSIALLAFAGAETVGGNGFIAAFAAGLVLGNSGCAVVEKLYEFGEAEGQLLSLLTFFVFGAIAVQPAFVGIDGRILLYALASLTLLRMVPVALSLIGLSLRPATLLFLGWFGPRGIATILYGLVVLEALETPGRPLVLQVAFVTVVLSTLAHGVSAWPLSVAFGRQSPTSAPAPNSR